ATQNRPTGDALAPRLAIIGEDCVSRIRMFHRLTSTLPVAHVSLPTSLTIHFGPLPPRTQRSALAPGQLAGSAHERPPAPAQPVRRTARQGVGLGRCAGVRPPPGPPQL